MARIKRIMDYEEFKELVHSAIGSGRTQSGFAEEAGISRSQMSKLLSGPDAAVPTIETLSRIAGHAEGPVTLRALMNSCGYPDDVVGREDEKEKERAASERSGMAPEERIFRLAQDISNAFEIERDGRGLVVAESPAGWLSSVQEDGGIPEGFAFESAGGDIPCDAPEYPGAEHYAQFLVSFDAEGFGAGFMLLIPFCRTEGGRCMLFGTVFDPEVAKAAGDGDGCVEMEMPSFRIPSLFGFVRMKEERKIPEVPIGELAGKATERFAYYKDCEGMDRESALMAALGLGGGGEDMRPACSEGHGIWLDRVPMKKAYDFLMNHRNEYRDPERIRPFYEFAEGKDYDDPELWRWFRDADYRAQFPHTEGDRFFGSAIAEIIYYNTGIALDAWNEDGKDKEYPYSLNRPVLFFANEEPWFYTDAAKQLSEDALERMLDEYALELGTEAGYVWYYYETDMRG